MAEVVRDKIEKRFGDVTAVAGIALTVKDQEFVILGGPSGCGKTTSLRMIAGLEEPTGGDIRIGGKSVVHVPPRDRDIAMVFQSYALYPHMTVFRNMGFSLQLRGMPKKDVRTRVSDVADILGITDLLDRTPPGSPASGASGSAAGAGAGGWARRCAARRACCCSTSRCRTSTPSCACTCAPSSSGCTTTSSRR